MGNVREIIMQGNEVTPFPFVDPGDKRRRRLHFASLNELLQQPVPPWKWKNEARIGQRRDSIIRYKSVLGETEKKWYS